MGKSRDRRALRDFRHGTEKVARPREILTASQRKVIVDRVFRLAKDWRSSPFEKEGPLRAGLRAALCLKGHSWAGSDNEAMLILAQCYRLIGAQRPSWEQGQREYLIPQEDCNWCARPLEPGQHGRFCSVECARMAITRRDYENGYTSSLVGLAAYRAIARTRMSERHCKHCGAGFHPVREGSDQVFCSHKCSIDYRKIPERKCLQCRKVFRPRTLTGKFCSSACYSAHGWTSTRVEYQRTCRWCFQPFATVVRNASCCSPSCNASVHKVKKGARKYLGPRVFDYLFAVAA